MAYFVVPSLKYLINRKQAERVEEEEEDFLIYDDNEAFNPAILASELCHLNDAQKFGFLVGVSVLCLLSLLGNISTLFVNFRRQLRPFFRTCLISLALSDLTSTIFLTVAYMTQFSTPYLQIWLLGGVMCKMVPWITTAAILSSSVTLAAIALDRYFAIMNTVIGCWNPTVVCCAVFMLGIWASSLGISGPLLVIYNLNWVVVYSGVKEAATVTTTTEVAVQNESMEAMYETETGSLIPMCISDDKHFVHYYVLLFVLIFLPCIIGFLWLNATIARKLWQRRHPIRAAEVHTTTQARRMPARESPTTSREARHVRMFVVILLMMAVFIFLRLPAWIFLVMRMYGTYSKHDHWILYFCFGILNLISCVLNPFFYTFLSQTLSCASKLKDSIVKCICCSGKSDEQNPTMPAEFLGKCFCCGLMYASLRCQRPSAQTDDDQRHIHIRAIDEDGRQSCQTQRQSSFENDEGVDCSDDVDSQFDFYDYSQRIYTIFSASLVSSSVSSKPSGELSAIDN